MTDVALKGVHKVRAKGHTYYYAWRGGPRLPGKPGSKEFLAAYVAATTHSENDKRLAGLVVAYKANPAFTRLADTTRKNWTPWLDRIRDDLGKLSIKAFDRPEIRQVIKRWRNKWKDAPRAADNGKQVLSAILSFAVEEGLLSTNPCFGISNLYSTDRSDLIWQPADIALFEKHAAREFAFALRLACLTGMRESDLIALEWSHVGDLAIEMKTGKSRGRLEYVVPLYDELRELLAEIRAYQGQRQAASRVAPLCKTVLIGAKGRPWTPNGFQSAWGDAKNAVRAAEAAYMADFKLHFHDARGTAATKFAQAGFADEDIAEIVGWEKSKVTRIIDRYVRRDARLKAKIERMNQASEQAQNKTR